MRTPTWLHLCRTAAILNDPFRRTSCNSPYMVSIELPRYYQSVYSLDTDASFDSRILPTIPMDAIRVLHSRGLGTAFTGDRVSFQVVMLSLASTIHQIHVVESIKSLRVTRPAHGYFQKKQGGTHFRGARFLNSVKRLRRLVRAGFGLGRDITNSDIF